MLLAMFVTIVVFCNQNHSKVEINRGKTVRVIEQSEGSDNGAGDRNRTHDMLITNQLLYLLSYASLSEGAF